MIKHDEADNARSFELDREAWVMMLGFPEDLRCDSIIAKSVSGFGIMVHWHECLNLARIIVKVYLNDDRKIPSSVKVNTGLPIKGKSWTVPVFVLKKKNVPELPDEDAFATIGPLHPVPPQPNRWNGPTPPAGSDVTPAASNAGGEVNMIIDEGGAGQNGNAHVDAATIPSAAQIGVVESSQLVQNRENMKDFGTQTSLPEDQLAPQPARFVNNRQLRDGNLIITWSDSDESRTVTDTPAEPTPILMSKMKSAMTFQGSSIALEPESPLYVHRMLFAEVLHFPIKTPVYGNFIFMSLCDIDPDIDAPTFFSDSRDLAHLLCLMPPQITDPESENAMVEILEDDDEVVEILNPTQFSARKKRAKKLREPLPKEFLRRSKRHAQKSGGFKGKSAVDVLNPKPLAVIPASPTQAPAPHLNKAIVEGIASGFLQIHPRDVSDALIKMDANEENK